MFRSDERSAYFVREALREAHRNTIACVNHKEMIMNLPLDLLHGMPVLVMRPGHYPSTKDVQDIMKTWPNSTVRTETMHYPHTRFVVTVRRRN
ncbi:MAG: hypothetical protein IPL32_17710 [Chloracidobacterium sp.]|nr:hypothetical protein [Chloracidobacterium sp.]